MADYNIPAKAHIGHVHMRAANLENIRAFYVDVLGFKVTAQMNGALFLAAGDYHHHLAFNTWQSLGGSPASAVQTGLYHIAINYPTRHDLAKIVQRLIDHNYPLQGASDHGTHEAIYLQDPEGNGLELACDRAQDMWPEKMVIYPLDVDELLSLVNKN